MDLAFSDEEISFRNKVSTFLKENLSSRLSQKVKLGKRLTKDDMIEWHSTLNRCAAHCAFRP